MNPSMKLSDLRRIGLSLSICTIAVSACGGGGETQNRKAIVVNQKASSLVTDSLDKSKTYKIRAVSYGVEYHSGSKGAFVHQMEIPGVISKSDQLRIILETGHVFLNDYKFELPLTLKVKLNGDAFELQDSVAYSFSFNTSSGHSSYHYWQHDTDAYKLMNMFDKAFLQERGGKRVYEMVPRKYYTTGVEFFGWIHQSQSESTFSLVGIGDDRVETLVLSYL